MVPIFLDSRPVWDATRPRGDEVGDPCRAWLSSLTAAGHDILIPEIVDYETRRELIRKPAPAGLRRLDALLLAYPLIPLDRAAILRAAALWADLRQRRKQTASNDALDGDVILLAQAIGVVGPGTPVMVATSNADHLERVPGVVARRWQDLDPAWLAANVPG